MLASVAIEPVQFMHARKPIVRATQSAGRFADPERQMLIEEIENVEGAPLGQVPILFRLVLLCGGVICVGAAGGFALGIAELVGRII